MLLTLKVEIESLETIARELTRIRRRYLGPITPLAGFSIRVTGETDMGKMRHEFDLPPLQTEHPDAADVVGGQVRLKFDGVDQPPIPTAKDQLLLGDVDIDKGVTVSAAFGWMDDDGNFSQNPTVLPDFVVADNVAPPDPVAGFGVRAVAELPD